MRRKTLYLEYFIVGRNVPEGVIAIAVRNSYMHRSLAKKRLLFVQNYAKKKRAGDNAVSDERSIIV